MMMTSQNNHPFVSEGRAKTSAGDTPASAGVPNPEDYLWLVRKIAASISRHVPQKIELDDLIGDGCVGLLNAAKNFDTSLGFKFSTYAQIRIEGAILDGLRHMDHSPRGFRKILQRADNALPGDDGTVGLEIGVGRFKLANCRNAHALNNPRSLNEIVFHDDAHTELIDCLSDQSTTDFKANVDDRLRIIDLENQLTKLTERERTILRMYYVENQLLPTIGEIIGLSESRISQIHKKALRKLREMQKR